MKPYIFSFIVGALVGVIYWLVGVRSPAPPLAALAGLLGLVLAEEGVPRALSAVAKVFAR